MQRQSGTPGQYLHGDTKPGHQAGDGGHVCEPAEHLAGARVDTHVGEGAEGRAEDDGDVGKAALHCGASKDTGRVIRKGEAVCVARLN